MKDANLLETLGDSFLIPRAESDPVQSQGGADSAFVGQPPNQVHKRGSLYILSHLRVGMTNQITNYL
jgi:hypothetical protein